VTQKYLFPCHCGQIQEIEASQAGQFITCSCGQTRQIPTLSKIKELEPAPEKASEPVQETGHLRRALLYLGLIGLVPSLLFLFWAVFSYPKPRDVSLKQVYFVYGQTKVYQDSTRLPDYEHQVLWIRNEDFDRMSPIELLFYFQMLEKGPNFSYNFQDNYQALKDAYTIRGAAASLCVFLSLLSIVASFFMPKKNVVVTGWSGTNWN